MKGCDKCGKMGGLLLLLLGVAFLLVDLGVWDFWNINWWTVGFIYLGGTGLAMASCGTCKK